MLLDSIQKTANFQHNEDNALNAHNLVVPIRYGLLGGLSVFVKARHFFCGGNN